MVAIPLSSLSFYFYWCFSFYIACIGTKYLRLEVLLSLIGVKLEPYVYRRVADFGSSTTVLPAATLELCLLIVKCYDDYRYIGLTSPYLSSSTSFFTLSYIDGLTLLLLLLLFLSGSSIALSMDLSPLFGTLFLLSYLFLDSFLSFLSLCRFFSSSMFGTRLALGACIIYFYFFYLGLIGSIYSKFDISGCFKSLFLFRLKKGD